MKSALMFAAAIGLSLSSATRAQVTIIPTGGTVITDENADVTVGGVTERQITLRATGSADSTVTIRATSGTTPVRYIKLKSVRFGSNFNHFQANVDESGGTFSHIRTIYRDPTSDAEVIIGQVIISGVAGDPGSPHTSSFLADVVSDIQATGGVTANITSGPRLFGAASNIANVSSSGGVISGDISTSTGSIIAVTAGDDLTGDVQAPRGSIGSITVPNGVIARGAGTALTILANSGIDTIDAQSISAWIGANSDSVQSVPPGTGNLRRLSTSVGGFIGFLGIQNLVSAGSGDGIDIAGDVSGSGTLIASVDSLKEPLFIAGDLASGTEIRVGGSVVTGGSNDGRISISGTHAGLIKVITSGGLGGQVTINSADDGGTWSGLVQVDGITLRPTSTSQPYLAPYYNLSSSTLGGGPVGLAPFHLHGADCTPANGSSHSFQSTTDVTLRHYGPVFWTSGSPVKVWWRLSGTSGAWNEIAGEDFTYTVGDNAREIVVSAETAFDFDALFDYRITPVAGVLKCAGVVGTPDVDDYEYILYGE